MVNDNGNDSENVRLIVQDVIYTGDNLKYLYHVSITMSPNIP